MAKTSKVVINTLDRKKYSTQVRNRCYLCGRPRGYIRVVGLCRLCFRELVHKGMIPGWTKASW